MNKLIEELMEESTNKGWEGDVAEFDPVKFADLIVKECAKFVDSQTADNGYGVADLWCNGKMLLNHFGVK